MKRLNLTIPDDFHNQMLAKKPVHQTLSAFAMDLIAAQLSTRVDTVANVAPCPAHAGNNQIDEVSVISEANTASEVIIDSSISSSIQLFEERAPHTQTQGESIGKEPEETPREGGICQPLFIFKDAIPPQLEWMRKELLLFWSQKGGKKNQHAGNFLFGQLLKIQEEFEPKVILEALEEGTAKGWQSITLKNFRQFDGQRKAASGGFSNGYKPWEQMRDMTELDKALKAKSRETYWSQQPGLDPRNNMHEYKPVLKYRGGGLVDPQPPVPDHFNWEDHSHECAHYYND